MLMCSCTNFNDTKAAYAYQNLTSSQLPALFVYLLCRLKDAAELTAAKGSQFCAKPFWSLDFSTAGALCHFHNKTLRLQ